MSVMSLVDECVSSYVELLRLWVSHRIIVHGPLLIELTCCSRTETDFIAYCVQDDDGVLRDVHASISEILGAHMRSSKPERVVYTLDLLRVNVSVLHVSGMAVDFVP